jgi:hypothetical protein
MEWDVGALQQKTKCIPPNTCYNLPNQPLDQNPYNGTFYFELLLKLYS